MLTWSSCRPSSPLPPPILPPHTDGAVDGGRKDVHGRDVQEPGPRVDPRHCGSEHTDTTVSCQSSGVYTQEIVVEINMNNIQDEQIRNPKSPAIHQYFHCLNNLEMQIQECKIHIYSCF